MKEMQCTVQRSLYNYGLHYILVSDGDIIRSKSHSAQIYIESNANVRNAGLHLMAPAPLLLPSVFDAAAAPSEPVAPVDCCALFVGVALESCVPVPLPLADPSDASLVSDASAFTNPCDAAVKVTPSTITADPPCDTV